MGLPTFLPYITAFDSGSRLEISLVSEDPSAVADASFPFLVISDSDGFSRLLRSRFRTDFGSAIRDVFLLLQRDNGAPIGNQTIPITNPEIEEIWQKTFEYHSGRPNGASLMTLSQQVDSNGRLLPFQPLFYCKAQKLFFHPPCPRCGQSLELCRDDAILSSVGLRTFSASASRYLYCPSCFSPSGPAEFYAYEVGSFDPPFVKDRSHLIRQFGDLAENRNQASGIPCWGCGQSGGCYGPKGTVSSNIVPFSFYPFFLLIFESRSVSAPDFVALLSGASAAELEEHLRSQGEFGRLRHLKHGTMQRRSAQTPFLFRDDPRFFLEVLYLKLSFLAQVIQVAFEGPDGSAPHPTLSLNGIWVELADRDALLPSYWNFGLEHIGLLQGPLETRVRPQLPLAYGFHYLGILWFQTLLVNENQDGPKVCEAIEKAYGQFVFRGNAEPSQELMSRDGSPFSPENVFWKPQTLSIEDRWHELWDRSLNLGWSLFAAALRGDADWSAQDFPRQFESLRQEIKRELFAAMSERQLQDEQGEDAAIYEILTKLMDKWGKESRVSEPETGMPGRKAGGEVISRQPSATEPGYPEAETLPLGFKMESGDEPISETIIISPRGSREAPSLSEAPPRDMVSERADGGVSARTFERTGESDGDLRDDSRLEGSEEEIPATVIIPPKGPGEPYEDLSAEQRAKGKPEHEERDLDVPETVIISPRKAEGASRQTPDSGGWESSGGEAGSKTQPAPKAPEAESVQDDGTQSQEEDISETIILSPASDRRSPGPSQSLAAHPAVRDRDQDMSHAERDLESEKERTDVPEDDLMSETIEVSPRKDRDKKQDRT